MSREGKALQELSVEDRIAGKYSNLSEKLRLAANFVLENQFEVATRSLRSISATTKLAPATFSRLARSLDFESYEELRELCRKAVGQSRVTFSQKAELLQDLDEEGEMPFLHRQANACLTNISQVASDSDLARLEQTADTLTNARRVVLFGGYASTGIVEYFAYLANFFTSDWRIAGRMGASLSTAIADLEKGDALVIITKPPFARRSIIAAKMAAELGVYVVVITDSYSCPALEFASTYFIIPSESPQFFSSYVATLMLIETLVGMLVARAGVAARQRIEEVERRNRMLGEFWEG